MSSILSVQPVLIQGSNTNKDSLSTGAIVGISIGLFIFVMFLLILVFFKYPKYNNKYYSKDEQSPISSGSKRSVAVMYNVTYSEIEEVVFDNSL